MSVHTLMRHCSSKADLAWMGVERSTAELRRALDAMPETVTPSAAIRTAVVDSVAHHAATFASLLAWCNDGARSDPPTPVDETVRWIGIDPLVTVGCEGGTG